MAVQISGNDITVPRDGSFTRNVTIGGTLTYEDVTNIDSVGLVTARQGIEVGSGVGVAASISVDGNAEFAGIVTATQFVGSGANLTSLPAQATIANNSDNRIITGGSGVNLNGEANLTFDGSDLTLQSQYFYIKAPDGGTRYFFGETGNSQSAQLSLYDTTDSQKVRIAAGDGSSDATSFFNGGTLHVGSTGASFDANGDDFTITNSSHGGISIITGTSSDGVLRFGDGMSGSAQYQGYINYKHASNSLVFGTQASERLRINGNGQIGIGADTVRTINSHAPAVQVQGDNYSDSTVSIINNANDSNGGYLFLASQRSGSAGGNTINQDDDMVGQIRFNGCDGNDLENPMAYIECRVDGTPGTNDMPGRLQFYTTPDGSGSPTEKLRILADGQIFTNGLDGSVDITVTGAADTYDGIQMGKPPFRVTRTSNVPAYLNRTGSGGNIIQFRYGGSVVGSISNNSNSLPSDRNYKKDITNLTLGLDLVNKLQPVSYHYKFDADSDPVMYGLIAQDVETALNDAGVAQNKASILQYEEKNDEKDSDYSLDYIKFTPILINAVKELSAEIESLKSEIAALKSS